MGSPARFNFGIASVPHEKPLGSYPLPDPFHTASLPTLGVVTYADDFVKDATADFTLAGTGTPALAIGSGVGGTLVATTTTGAADSVTALKTGTAFAFVAGQKFWFNARVALSDANTSAMLLGIGNSVTPTDGIYFSKASGSTSVRLVSKIGSTATTVTSVATAANATFMDLAFRYNGSDLLIYAAGALVKRIESYTPPTVQITPFFSITNGAAAANTLTLDYLLAAAEIVR